MALPLTPYTPTVWINDDRPDLDAEHLNKLEDGVKRSTDGVNQAHDEALGAKADAATFKALLDAHVANINNPHHVTAAQVGATGGSGSGGGYGKVATARGAKGDDATDNTAILQALLDEIRDEGGGTLILPNDKNNHTYRTRCLWVPPYCTIQSDGAVLKNIGWSTDTRYASWDGDQIAADGVLTIQPQTRYGYGAIPSLINIRGVLIDVSSARQDGILTYGIDVGGSNVHIDRCQIFGDPKDCINLGERRGQSLSQIHIRNSILTGARRNIISIEGADIRYVWIQNNVIGWCSGVPTPVGGGEMDASPGAGIDIEQPSAGGSLAHIQVLNNWITNNAGPGIAFSLQVQPSDTLEGTLIQGNRISDNSGNPGGGIYGGIWLAAGRTDQTVRIIGNHIDGTRQGAGIQGQPADPAKWRMRTLIGLNSFWGNAGGNISIPAGGGATVSQTGNL